MEKIELKKWCRNNWDQIDENKRQVLINHIKAKIPVEVIEAWRKNGYDHMGFHSFGGMAVRNVLRQVMKDDELPGVEYPWDKSMGLVKNWDDYYTGALDQLLEGE